MSRNINVNPGQYKIAGRERQGEDVISEREKQTYARSKPSARRASNAKAPIGKRRKQ